MVSGLRGTSTLNGRARGRGWIGRGFAGAMTLVLAVTAMGSASQDADTVRILIETEQGEIEVELEAAKAPVTTENFLRYVDAGHFDGGSFHRSVRLENRIGQTRNRDALIQGGLQVIEAQVRLNVTD